ncbi:MAG: substrate-binding domain-containing protein [Propionibacteriaceae bacterium]|nr:substrate-binding domain-containing protein [Propionibacteriaceae bacterium]
MKKWMTALAAVAAFAVALTGCSTAASAPESSGATKTYKIALSNSFLGNDWRQLMIKTTQVVATKAPYAGKVDLTVVNSENTAEAQAASIDALASQGYDAIIVNAASATALNPAVKRAQDSGIVVVSFDNTVQADGVYAVSTDLSALATGWANYLAAKVPSGGKIAVDTGMPGSTAGNTLYESAMKVFKEHNINVVAEFAGQYADGVGQQQIGSILAAHPDLDGIYTQVYAETVAAAFKDAGRKLVPATAFDTNAGMLAAIDNKMDVMIGNNVPGLGAIALKVAVDVLDGKQVPMKTQVTPGFFSIDDSVDISYPVVMIKEGENAFRNLPGALDWPALPADFQPQVTIDEISNYKQ